MTQPNVSALPTQWEDHGYRDENARRLVRAIYQFQKVLFKAHAFVPVQGYCIPSDGEQLAVALSIGALITLWDRQPSMQTPCSNCGGLSLLFGIGGATAMGLFACCIECGFMMWRTGEAEVIMAELTSALAGSPFRVPSQEQFLTTLAAPHTALVEALRAVGAKLLPSDDYGFVSGAPGFFFSWRNQLLARAATWAGKGLTFHIPTGARLEFTEVIFRRAVEKIAEYVERTGCLPEVELEIGDGIRVEFPMISQELITPVDLESED
jgi:hypothetical protein